MSSAANTKRYTEKTNLTKLCSRLLRPVVTILKYCFVQSLSGQVLRPAFPAVWLLLLVIRAKRVSN